MIRVKVKLQKNREPQTFPFEVKMSFLLTLTPPHTDLQSFEPATARRGGGEEAPQVQRGSCRLLGILGGDMRGLGPRPRPVG